MRVIGMKDAVMGRKWSTCCLSVSHILQESRGLQEGLNWVEDLENQYENL